MNWPGFHLHWRQVRKVAGVVIFRSSATVYFANAELYEEALGKKVRACVHTHTHSSNFCAINSSAELKKKPHFWLTNYWPNISPIHTSPPWQTLFKTSSHHFSSRLSFLWNLCLNPRPAPPPPPPSSASSASSSSSVTSGETEWGKLQDGWQKVEVGWLRRGVRIRKER